MVKVKVFSIGKSREEWLNLALFEYEKRLQGKMAIEWLFVKDDEALISATRKETVIALDPHGELLSSEAFCQKIGGLGAHLSFVIGGANGLPASILKQARAIWSLSPLTFTHQMTRLILLEQLYRATEIERGSSYHRGEPHGSTTSRRA
ncbi:MAG: 23S rRNA (pseudouridine(1915)-N(3))-methyltransferase RlmH [Verrucomicrobia bacterium]|nr:23S rRNA (pseudouridine(1915)-N(3))-methyltransferase RlmH [Verrucomicrobiota bacterium]MBU6447018.1 23S rRNA (pseudouridine(1915)-N(3))-methyltransferase RlmH [Verrucomicrobiota bacterium]MDE3046788.1 23S rRNA (pseudouridine(1915)-N(3))-methyltransferase RlmH [Verrucomicrobiota bacterium]